MVPFEMDSEYATCAAAAVVPCVPGTSETGSSTSRKRKRIDIRELKRRKKEEDEKKTGKKIIDYVFQKVMQRSRESESSSNTLRSEVDASTVSEEADTKEYDKQATDKGQFTMTNKVEAGKQMLVRDEILKQSVHDKQKADTENTDSTAFNRWVDSKSDLPDPLPDIENKPIVTEEFRKKARRTLTA